MTVKFTCFALALLLSIMCMAHVACMVWNQDLTWKSRAPNSDLRFPKHTDLQSLLTCLAQGDIVLATACTLQADILMVTDGEIPRPSEWVKKDLKAAVDDLGLEIHGLLVGQQDTTPAMQDICTHLHVFKSWSAVGGKRNYYY